MNFSPFLALRRSCDEALPWSKERLLQAGLRPVQTFDLHAARSGLHDCSCPNHGTEDCDCQLAVILVYGKADEPATLILHGNDGQTWFSLAGGSIQASEYRLTVAIQQALEFNVPEPKDS